ncbi:MAG: aminotransferase class III-fold pyridoxal phosphate-dependent enzyme, partial [Streptosporangiaceae bacterium]
MSAADGAARETALWHPFATMATVPGHTVTMVRGAGSTVYDASGQAYLDAIASLWYVNVGYGRAELAEAAATQLRALACYQAYEVFSSEPAEELAWRVSALAPLPDAKVFFTPGGGSDAVDSAAKLARAYWGAVGQPGKQIII